MQDCPRTAQPPSEQTPPEQVSVEQHWLEEEQPAPLRPQVPSEQTPPEQVIVPQHWYEAVHRVPAPWHEPPLQTLLALQSSVPQQSALLEQRWSLPWQGTTPSPPGISSSPPELLQERRKNKDSRARALSEVRAMATV